MPDAVANLRHRLLSVRKACGEIGRVPPRPPGLRAAAGGLVVSLMHRLMFWYAPAIERALTGLTGVVDDALGDLDRMIQQDAARIAGLENHIRSLDSRMGEFDNRLQQSRLTIEHQLLDAVQQERRLREYIGEVRGYFERLLQDRAEALEALAAEHTKALELDRATTITMEGDLREQTEILQQMEEERRQKEEELERRLGESAERLQLVRREVLENSQRLVRLLAGSTPAEAAPPRAAEHFPELDAVEAALESEWRGARGEAEERWKPYLALMPREGPVLDIGCGRGEWLELLRRDGIPARGVEANRLLAAECRERLLETEHADAFDYLARTPDGAAAAVTVLRLVERLPLAQLVRLVDEVARVLRPGGTAVFEAPNADNVLVAGRRHAVPSEILRCVVEARGLDPVEVRFLNPAAEEERVPEEDAGALTRRFNRFFYGPRDYAVVCRKAPPPL